MHPKIDPQEFINNTSEVADKCDVKFNFKNMVPKLEDIKMVKNLSLSFANKDLKENIKLK